MQRNCLHERLPKSASWTRSTTKVSLLFPLFAFFTKSLTVLFKQHAVWSNESIHLSGIPFPQSVIVKVIANSEHLDDQEGKRRRPNNKEINMDEQGNKEGINKKGK